jgi:hypothetical protein
VWKIPERQTLTTSRTLKTYFKKEREGIIKGLVVIIFYCGEDSARRKDLYFKDSLNCPAKCFSLHLLPFCFLPSNISCIVIQT